MRGKVKPFLCPLCHKGITPAYAGKSLFTFRKVMRLRDHPRLCGEKCCFCIYSPVILGSPPPMRGKDYQNLSDALENRITPAYAGKSDPQTRSSTRSRDHPRLCGEKAVFRFSVEICLGSPPPMRGKVDRDFHISVCFRITPAYAGKRRVRYGRSR